jgi:hypothetical protein
MLRGFGKKYFTLASILAYSTAPRLLAQKTAHLETLKLLHVSSQEDTDNDLFDELLTVQPEQIKPCHCNCIFKRKIRLILLLNHFIPRCAFYTKYFAFRRTGVHPPLSTLL